MDANHFSVIGAVHFLEIGRTATDAVRAQGPKIFYDNASWVDSAHSSLDERMSQVFPNLAAGGMHYIRDVQMVPWGMIEVEPGSYKFDLLDDMISTTQAAGLEFIANVMPFADWDQVSSPPADASCNAMLKTDAFYLAKGGRMSQIHDLDAFARFVQKAAERYDGDGVDDAPGLKRPVAYWKIFNEPEGADCGGYRNNPSGFVTLMSRARQAVLASCATCKVLNGGAGIALWKNTPESAFWSEFAKAGGADTVDVIAAHYNQGKNQPNEDEDEYLETQITTLRSLLGMSKPVWMTEFGVMVQDPERPAPAPSDAGHVLLQRTEAEAAPWYFRRYVVGLAAGATRFFSDTQSFFASKIYWTFWINRLVESTLGTFTSAKKIAPGQFQFTVGGKPVYALWSGVPSELVGKVRVTDLYGRSSVFDATALSPMKNAPVFATPE